MKSIVLPIILLLASASSYAQSDAMKKLVDRYPDATTFVIYHSHFTMINQNNDPNIAALAATIDKIKVLTLDSFSSEAQKDLIADIGSEGFESLITIKHSEADIIAYILEEDGNIEGYFLIVKSEENTMAVDVIGSPDVKQIGTIIDTIKNH